MKIEQECLAVVRTSDDTVGIGLVKVVQAPQSPQTPHPKHKHSVANCSRLIFLVMLMGVLYQLFCPHKSSGMVALASADAMSAVPDRGRLKS